MSNRTLSQEEIDSLLRGTEELDPQPETPPQKNTLDEMEKDALGEIANISMGTAATTLSQLLGKKVDITTPKVELTTSEQIQKDYPVPSVICSVRYKSGLVGSNLLILSQEDGAIIVDLMMGGDGKNPTPELSELQISGISEAMNQMIGSAATSMSNMFDSKVDITPPNLVINDLSNIEENFQEFLQAGEPLVRIIFRMVVEGVIDSSLLQLIPLTVAKGMVEKLMNAMAIGSAAEPAAPADVPSQPASASASSFSSPSPSNHTPAPSPTSAYEAQPSQTSTDYPPYGAANGATQSSAQGGIHSGSTIPVQPVRFAALQSGQPKLQTDNLDLVLDLPLQISVELGRAKKTIKEILEMGPGSVIELDRLAGEAVDMIVNGKLIAKCEVVVINELFGIRITDIIHPVERMNSLK